MDIYILDSLYRRIDIVDVYESFIWTERFSAMGDFELNVLSTLQNRSRLIPGVKLAHANSRRVMEIATTEDASDDEGKQIIKVTGNSLERILDDRVARGLLSDLTNMPKWVLTGTPKAIAQKIFHDVCTVGVLDPSDIVTSTIEGSIYPADTISPPSETITIELDPTTVYQAIKQICDQYHMGFRIVRAGDTAQLYFDIYMGSDRTSHQATLPAVIFSPGLENLKNTTELKSNALYKNVAYVISPVGHEIVYATDVDPLITGYDRRVLLVTANDITDTDPDTASQQMILRGKQELAKNVNVVAFDGEISQTSQYQYERDYYLGDIVEQQNIDGVANNMQVTEQIFASDANGDRSYPTLTLNETITPGSWAAWDFNQDWVDLNADPTTWSDEP